MGNLLNDLTKLLNEYSMENDSNTPDYQLAEFMLGALELFSRGIKARDAWYGMNPEPGDGSWASRVPEQPKLRDSREG